MESFRVAFVADRCEPYYRGGYERHVWELARRLAKRHEVTVFTSLPSLNEEREGVQFIRAAPYLRHVREQGGHGLGQATFFSLALLPRLPKGATYDFIDVLGIPYVQIPFVRYRQVLEAWHWGITIWEAWYNYSYLDGWGERPARATFRALLRLSLTGNHVVIAGSNCTRRALVQHYEVPESRIAVIPPGVDTQAIASIAPASCDSDAIYIGRLENYKRVGDLIDATGLLKEQGLKIKVSIVGEGPDRSYLGARASKLGVDGQIQFHGWLPERDKYALLKASRIFVLPSEREGFSIATLEAMSCGVCPLVARPSLDEAFGVGDLVREGESGLVFPVGMPDKLAAGLSTLIFDEARRRELARSALGLSQGYDLDVIANQYELKVLSRRLDR